METLKRVLICTAMLVAVAYVATTTRAEDFSVDLKRLAEIDETQAMPEYTLDRVLIQSEGTPGSDMLEKTFDVCIRFKDFGNVRLAEAREAGPSTGQHWREGMTFNSGLANLAEVKTGWIKDSPNLCLIAWLDEPDGRGNGNLFGHGYVILQFQGRRARVLLRGSSALNARVRGGIQEGALHSSHFSFSPKRRLLEERVTRYYEKASDRPHNLGHPFKEEDGEDVLVARIHETIKLTYRLANGKLLPRGGSLVYKAQKQDELAEVARFYLGPYATRSALLKANASLAQRYKDSPPGTLIYLAEGMEINVPVPQEWLMDHFGHGLTMGQGIDRGDQGE